MTFACSRKDSFSIHGADKGVRNASAKGPSLYYTVVCLKYNSFGKCLKRSSVNII